MRSWVWGPQDGTSALIERKKPDLSVSVHYVSTQRKLYHTVGRQPSGKSESRPSSGTKSPGTSIWDFPAFTTVRKKILLFRHQSTGICYSLLNWLRWQFILLSWRASAPQFYSAHQTFYNLHQDADLPNFVQLFLLTGSFYQDFGSLIYKMGQK